MNGILESKEYKALEKALMKRLRYKLDPNGKTKPDAVIKDLVRRYMDAWSMAEDARSDIRNNGHFCVDDRKRRYNNPSVKTLSDAEALMERLQRIMDIKTEDLASAMEEDEDEL